MMPPILIPLVETLMIYAWSEDAAKSWSTKTWFDMGIFPYDGRVITYHCLVDKTPCYTSFDTDASKAMLSKKFYNEHTLCIQ